MQKRLLLLLFLVSQLMMAQHPRLFFTNNDTAALRAKLQRAPFNEIVKDIRLLYQGYQDPYDTIISWNYDPSIGAAFGGLLYLLTDSSHYAIRVKQLVRERINDNTQWAVTNYKGLTLYWHGHYVALAYDWCYNSPDWPQSFKDSVSLALWNHGRIIIDNGGTEQNTNTASNWQGIRGAAGGMCLLATDESYPLSYMNRTILKVDRYVKDNYGDQFTSKGWNIEGLGYFYYPTGNFIGPFAIAIKRFIPNCDFTKHAGFVNAYWTIYSSLSNAMNLSDNRGCVHPDFGDDNPHVSGEGVFGQSFYFLPDSLKPYAKYWYDKIFTKQNAMYYEKNRAGSLWNYLYYPDSLAGNYPMLSDEWMDNSVETGGNGYFTYRNSYVDSSDVISQLYVKLRGNRGHSGPDALTFRIFGGGGTAWAVGGGRYGPKIASVDAYKRSMNTLYPFNPDATYFTTNSTSGKVIGNPFIADDGSGHVISYITENNVRAKEQKRWYITDFDSAATGANAVIIVGDTSLDGTFWQLCSYEFNIIDTSANTFTIMAHDSSATLKGTILHPVSNFRYTIGKRIRGSNFGSSTQNSYIHFQSNDGDFLVAMTIVPKGKTHPTVSADGSKVTNNVVHVGTKTYELTQEDVLYNGSAIDKEPVAHYSANRQSGPAPLKVSFDASASFDPEGDSISYAWDFGDGSTSYDSMPVHSYTNEGTYRVSLLVSDKSGNTNSQAGIITVNNTSLFGNLTPHCILNAPANNSTYDEFDTILIDAWANDVDGYIQRVDYYAGTTFIGTDSVYPFYFEWQAIPDGTFSITARAYDNTGKDTVSNAKTVIINNVIVDIDDVIAMEEQPVVIEPVVYPNPSNGFFRINTNQEIRQLTLLNLSGQVLVFDANPAKNKQYDIRDLGKGIFIVKIETDAGVFVKQLVNAY